MSKISVINGRTQQQQGFAQERHEHEFSDVPQGSHGDKLTDMRILLLNMGIESAREVTQALSGQGYEITEADSLAADEIFARSPDLLITEATPSALSCCGPVLQIKPTPHPRPPHDLK